MQRGAFEYFLHETNPTNGLVADKSQPGAPASIAAVGFALAVYPVGVLRSWMTRAVLPAIGHLLLWSLMRACPYVVAGLRRAGFTNGWL